jgi:hypothetical protein
VDRASNHAALDDQQHLTAEIELERASPWQPRLRRPRPPQRSACPWADDTVAADPFPTVEGNHRIASLVTEDAVDRAPPEVAEIDESPLQ